MNIKVAFNCTRPAFTESNVEDNDVAAIWFPLEYVQYSILPIKMSCFRIRHTNRIQNINERMLRREHANKRHLGGSINVNFSVRQYVAVKNIN
jgi:hypothetical protein